MNRRIMAAAVVCAAVGTMAGCSAGGDADELEAQLAAVTAERDALQVQIDADASRYDKTVTVKDTIEQIVADPSSFGEPGEVADMLGAYATSGAQMRDDVFGDVAMRQGWYYTLSGGLDAEVETVHSWVTQDGSQSGALWIWRGVNYVGAPFELVGISVLTHDDEGLVSDEWVAYPYPDAFVEQAIDGAGTPTTVTGEPFDSAP